MIIMANTLRLIVCFILLCSSCQAYKVLVLYFMPGRSHAILGDGIVRQLLKDGNEVTYITPILYKNPPPNLRQVDIGANFKVFPSDFLNLTSIMNRERTIDDYNEAFHLMLGLCQKTLENDNVQKLFNDPNEHFDVIVAEWLMSDIFAGVQAVFDCPFIWMTPMEVGSTVLSLIDQTPSTSFVADLLSTNTAPFTFEQRVEELWMHIKKLFWGLVRHDRRLSEVYEEVIAPIVRKKGRVPPSYETLRYNASLMLGNSHVSMGQPTPLPQSYKPIGGYHIEDEVKPLPEDLKKIMDSAKNGVIYFSMGSNLKSKDWPDEIKRGLLKMFGELKQTVIWKFEEQLNDVPKNVHIVQWAPQPSILSHIKCILFITHGGLLSTTETIHYGVPIIGIPVFGDQFVNVKRAVKKGFALEVDLSYTLAEDLKVAITEMLSNPKYRQKVQELSYIYHDRPVKPAAEVAHWVRHVVQTRGAPHLRSPAIDVPFYQKLYLDLAAIIIAVFVVLLKCVRCVLPARKSSNKVDTKKKRK